jgi:hypothetical protein
VKDRYRRLWRRRSFTIMSRVGDFGSVSGGAAVTLFLQVIE